VGLNEEGYLSSDISAYPQEIRARNAEYFRFFDKVHRFYHEKKFLVRPHNRDGQHVFAVGLSVKLICDVEAAVILMERGLSSQSRSMLRVATETLIKLANICKAYEFVEAYIKTGEHQRLLFLRGMRNNPSHAYDFILPELTDELISEISENASDKKVAQWARDAGMSDLYNVPYRLYSQDVHSAPASLELYLVTNEEGDLT